MANLNAGQADIAACVLEAIQAMQADYPDIKGIEYEQTPTDPSALPCITMQTLDGPPVNRHYLDGGCVANYRFALQLRHLAQDGSGRLDARATLGRIAKALVRTQIDLGEDSTAWGLAADTLPCRIETGETYADWQIEFTLKYHTT